MDPKEFNLTGILLDHKWTEQEKTQAPQKWRPLGGRAGRNVCLCDLYMNMQTDAGVTYVSTVGLSVVFAMTGDSFGPG